MGWPPQACFFDLDGTLVDSEPMWVSALGLSLAEVSCRIGEDEIEQLVYGRSWLDIHADLCGRFPDRCEDRSGLEERIEHHFKSLKRRGNARIDTSIRLLIRLAREWPVAIVSGSGRRMVDQWVEDLGLRPHLRFFLGCEDYPVGKPDPACYLLAAARLGVPPASCLVFEDSKAGVGAAKRAGMSCIALQRSNVAAQDLSAADRIVRDLGELDDDELSQLFNLGSPHD